MSDQTTNPQVAGGYGYATDEVKVSPFNFGGNFGVTSMTKFEFINNGGAGGAEGEALDIVFNINGTEKSYRQFPVTKAYDKNNQEVTDPNSEEMRDAFVQFNARITHVLHCFLDSDTIKAGFSRPIGSFKEYCQIAMEMLPKNFAEKKLDIFLQFQWQISEGQNRTYLELPKKMSYGRWLAPATEAVGGAWKEIKVENPDEKTREALYYEDGSGNKHPFVRNGWFMLSNFAKQQSNGEASSDIAQADANISGNAEPAPAENAAPTEAGKTSAW